MRKKRILICEICLSRNYVIMKKTSDTERLEMNKFCSRCKKHTLHKESK